MAVISLIDTALATQVDCALCKQTRALHEVYIGLPDQDGQPQFACNTHLLSSSTFIKGWVRLMIEQMQSGKNYTNEVEAK